jgi:hypothetical protein
VFSLLGAAITVFVLLLIADRLKIIRAVSNKLNE